MKRWPIYALVGLLGYGVFMLAYFPAANLLALAGDQVPGGLRAAQTEGTLLAGSAKNLRLGHGTIQSLTWRWRPLALFTGRWEYALAVREPGLDLSAMVSLDSARAIRITGLQGQAALERVAALASPYPLLLDGDLTLQMEELCLDPTGIPNAARGTIQLSDTRTSIGRAFALGDFYATFTTADKIIRGEIKDTGGPLDLTGTLTHDPDGRYGFSGELGVRDESNAELRQILGILGQPGTDGKWPLELTGSLGS